MGLNFNISQRKFPYDTFLKLGYFLMRDIFFLWKYEVSQKQNQSFLFGFFPTMENEEEFCIRVCLSFFDYFKTFLFSTQNQVPQIVIDRSVWYFILKPL